MRPQVKAARAICTVLVVLLLSVSDGQSQENKMEMEVVVDNATKEIKMKGSLNSDRMWNTVIIVNIIGVPKGNYKMTKEEYNGQSKPWGMWALRFGAQTTLDTNVPVKSNFFKRSTWVPERNCLVFDQGTVDPGQTLIKTWGIIHKGGGPIQVLHYERTGPTNLTMEDIEKGWGDKPIDAVINVTPTFIN